MPDAQRPIQRLHAHRGWSHDQLLEVCRALTDEQLRQSFPIGMGSVWATLVHLMAAEEAWLRAIEGDESGSMLTEADVADWASLEARWSEVRARWDELLAGLTEDDLSRPVSKRRAMPGRASEGVYTTSLEDVLLHVCTHAAYTSAQAVNMLRQLGVEGLPDLQLIRMARGAGR